MYVLMHTCRTKTIAGPMERIPTEWDGVDLTEKTEQELIEFGWYTYERVLSEEFDPMYETITNSTTEIDTELGTYRLFVTVEDKPIEEIRQTINAMIMGKYEDLKEMLPILPTGESDPQARKLLNTRYNKHMNKVEALTSIEALKNYDYNTQWT